VLEITISLEILGDTLSFIGLYFMLCEAYETREEAIASCYAGGYPTRYFEETSKRYSIKMRFTERPTSERGVSVSDHTLNDLRHGVPYGEGLL
jgi:hypothetical protein